MPPPSAASFPSTFAAQSTQGTRIDLSTPDDRRVVVKLDPTYIGHYRTLTPSALRDRVASHIHASTDPNIASLRVAAAKQLRGLATVSNVNHQARGPMEEYDERVHSHRLREDEHQRGIVQHLQDLHDELKNYREPKVVHPSLESLKPRPKWSFRSLFGRGSPQKPSTQIPPGSLKGLYMYGDVGSGKTMLMDMFYETLPPNITSKTRIHFHSFMQDVHKRLHAMKMEHGTDLDALLYVAADIAEKGSVLCFDEFQCTDVADAMILRRLLEALMSHGVVLVTTSNRHPDDLYKNGIQRASFIPCINLLKTRLQVLNLDSSTDYRKIPRPPSGVYHHPLDKAAISHAEKWFRFLGDPEGDPPHAATHQVWGRDVHVPKASGKAAMFTFDELIGRSTGAADYLELMRSYEAFIVTGVPAMTYRERDLARRFITFIDAVYESRAKLVLTTSVPLFQLFLSPDEVAPALTSGRKAGTVPHQEEHEDVDSVMRNLMDDLGLNMQMLKESSIFSGDEERFAFARALSRLSEMGGREWVERGLGLEARGGLEEREGWKRVRSRWREDSL
ncbi:mitochondrial atpase [Lasallia pustulata]|uniref:Mitochondrial atpase n=1 Tax=Lasallia pustulata TaxID=136370 RepID=A0A1W5DCN0_9LECA|nr:mitochondrial atpase [Lasallia pustulata]